MQRTIPLLVFLSIIVTAVPAQDNRSISARQERNSSRTVQTSSVPAVPIITSIAPASAIPGSTVVITGSGFNTEITKNIVRSGAVRASIVDGSPTELTIMVPTGATAQPLMVTDTASGLSAWSSAQFLPTFSGADTIGTASFGDRFEVQTGANPVSVSIGDFDGDGKPDVAVLNNNQNTISILRNISPAEQIVFDPKTDISTGAHPYYMVCVDLDGDGSMDLACVNKNDNSISVFRNISSPGTIQFSLPLTVLTGSGPAGLTFADYDGDGRSDLAVTNNSYDSIQVYRNLSTPGAISFAPAVSVQVGNSPFYLTSGDIDMDGRPDIAVGNYGSGSVSLLRNTSTPGNIIFAGKIDIPTVNNPYGVILSDFDTDGALDIAVGGLQDLITIYRNLSIPGTVSVSPRIDFPLPDRLSGSDIQSADLNGDGAPDLVIPNNATGGSTCSVLMNIGTNDSIAFASLVDVPLDGKGYGTGIGDLDGDTKPDLIVTNHSSGNISVIHNLVPFSNGLVAWYPFQGNAKDKSGNGHHGAVFGAALTEDRFLRSNTAYEFDGSNQYIQIPFSPDFNTTSISISVWVKMSSLNAEQNMIIRKNRDGGAGSGEQFALYLNNDQFWWNALDLNPNHDTTTLGSISSDRWYHVVWTMDSTSQISSLYVDGVHRASKSNVLGYIHPASTDITIGAHPHYGNPYGWNGSIDDIRIYRRALNHQEIQSLYHENGYSPSSPVSTLRIDSVVAYRSDTLLVAINADIPETSIYSSFESELSGYAGGLTFLGIDTAGTVMGAKGWDVQVNGNDSSIFIGAAGASGISGHGVLLNLKFAVSGTACSFAPIQFRDAFFNTGADSIAWIDGGIKIKAIPVYGDVDLNDQVQAYDAATILNYLMWDSVLSCQALANADVTSNGEVSAFDATVILKHVVHLIPTLPYTTPQPASAVIAMSRNGNRSDLRIPVTISSPTNVQSFEGRLSYDPSFLRFVSLLWKQSVAGFSVAYSVDSINGTVTFIGADSQNNVVAGTMMEAAFTAITDGKTDVAIDRIRWNENAVIQHPVSLQLLVGVEMEAVLPNDYTLSQNFPNPFNPSTTLTFTLPERSHITISVFDMLGREVALLMNDERPAGRYTVEWNAGTLSSGLYVARMTAGRFTSAVKMTLMK